MPTRLTDHWRYGSPGDGAGEVAVRAVRDRIEAAGEALVRAAVADDDDAESVHAVRVAARRAAAAIAVFAEWIPTRRARQWKARLDRVRQAAGSARDTDILARRLAHETDEVVKAVVDDLFRDRAKTRRPIRRIARRAARKDWFTDRLKKLLRRMTRQADGRDERFDTWAAARLATVVDRFFRAAPEDGDVRALHRFRIRAKELRYALELLCGAFPAVEMDAAYTAVEAVQKDLGDINDTVTRLGLLRDRMRETDDPGVFDRLRAMVSADDACLERSRAEFLAGWTADRGDTLRHLLDRLLVAEPVFAGAG